MTQEFIPYEQALELKELGFDERCFGVYYADGRPSDLFATLPIMQDNINSKIGDGLKKCTRPTFSQCFRWFREKYSLYHCIIPNKSVYDNYVTGIFYIEVLDSSGLNHAEYDDNEYFYEEAELACLKKLIEIVKNKQQ